MILMYIGIGYDNDLLTFYPSNLGLYKDKPDKHATKLEK